MFCLPDLAILHWGAGTGPWFVVTRPAASPRRPRGTGGGRSAAFRQPRLAAVRTGGAPVGLFERTRTGQLCGPVSVRPMVPNNLHFNEEHLF